MPIIIDDVKNYYSPRALKSRLEAALAAIGKSLDELTIEDLAVVDEFHIRGQAATNELIAAAGFTEDSRVLDLGCGLGGPARRLALTAGCKVVGVDLSGEYISCAQYLTELLDLQQTVEFKQANCLDLPFADASFDGAWTIQMMMNIEQKQNLIKEAGRVLKPGGRFIIYEIMSGNELPLFFPVPWAQSPQQNSLCNPAALKAMLLERGFVIGSWEDKTLMAKQAFEGMQRPTGNSSLPALGVHFLVGDDILTKAYNVKQNLDEGRISLLQAVVINS